MISVRAKLVNGFLRQYVKRMPLHQMTPEKVRAFFDRAPMPPPPRGVCVTPVDATTSRGRVLGEWQSPAMPDRPAGRRALLYFHGGGYVFGSPRTYHTLTFRLAKEAHTDVFSLDYRLAPEHPCPAAIDDAVAAYHWLMDQGFEPSQIAMAGDSAGGGLTLACLQALIREGAPMPACAVLYSPYTDLTASSPSIVENAQSDALFHADAITMGKHHYVGDLSPTDPRVSPLFGDMAGLPPMLIFASRDEMLYDDAERLVPKMRAEGVDVEFIARDGLVHIWPIFCAIMPEGKKDVAYSAAFIRRRLSAAAVAGPDIRAD